MEEWVAKKFRLLVVEDERETSRALRRVAREMGLEVVVPGSARSSMDVFRDADMMIVNWHLPEIETEELLNTWFRTKTGPVAVLYSEMPDITHARLLTLSTTWNVLPQPPTTEALQNTVRVLLKRYIEHVSVHNQLAEMHKQIRWLAWVLAGTIASFTLVSVLFLT